VHKPVSMVLMINDVQSFPASIALAAWIIFIPPNFDYTVVLNSNLKTTEISA